MRFPSQTSYWSALAVRKSKPGAPSTTNHRNIGNFLTQSSKEKLQTRAGTEPENKQNKTKKPHTKPQMWRLPENDQKWITSFLPSLKNSWWLLQVLRSSTKPLVHSHNFGSRRFPLPHCNHFTKLRVNSGSLYTRV